MKDEPGPSRPKKICTTQLKREKNEEECDFEDSGSEFDCSNESSSDSDCDDEEIDEGSSRICTEDAAVESSLRPAAAHESDEESEDFIEEKNPTAIECENKTVNWTHSADMNEDISFKKRQELLVQISGSRPIDFFNTFVDHKFLSIIVQESNKYAINAHCKSGKTEPSRTTQWKNIDAAEIKIFIGLLLHMGTVQLKRIQDYWKTDRIFDIPIFREQMSRNRFYSILKSLHFYSGDLTDDRLDKIRPVVDYFNSKMETSYYPSRELTLDESVILWRGQFLRMRHTEHKHHKHGISLYTLTEPDGVALKVVLYVSGDRKLGGADHSNKVVMASLEGKLKNGHSLFAGSFYSSYDLVKLLLRNETYCTGKILSNRKHNPNEVVDKKLKTRENVSLFSERIHVGKWKDSSEFLYITSEFKNKTYKYKNKRGRETQKPVAIMKYEKHMTSVDRQERMMSYYPCKEKYLRWYKKIFIHTLQLLMINSHKCYNRFSGEPNLNLYGYRISIIKALLPARIPQRTISTSVHQISKIEATTKDKGNGKRVQRKRCRLCSKRGQCKKTVYHCESCKEKPGLCVECFDEYHLAKQAESESSMHKI